MSIPENAQNIIFLNIPIRILLKNHIEHLQLITLPLIINTKQERFHL
jgi:hypothetical protein